MCPTEEAALAPAPEGTEGEEAHASLIRELGDLGKVSVSAAARERTWAAMREELRSREGGAAVGGLKAQLIMRGSWRWVAGSAVVLVAAGMAALSLYPERPPTVASSTVTSVIVTATSSGTPALSTSSATTAPSTVPTAPGVGPSTTHASGHTGTQTTLPSGDFLPTRTTVPPTTAGTGSSSSSTSDSTSTTGMVVLTRMEREASAQTLALLLGRRVVTGNVSGAALLVTGQADSGLVMLASSLREPYDPQVAVVDTTGDVSRVLLEIKDRRDDEGNPVKAVHRFLLEVKVDVHGAVVVGIYKAGY